MTERTLHTRYPSFNVLDKWNSQDFDDQTREVVQRRLEKVPPIRFFNEHEALTLAAIADCIIPQPERALYEKVPIVPWIDEKLFEDHRDGYRYDGMPPQRDAWRQGLKGIDEASATLYGGKVFTELNAASKKAVLEQIETGKSAGETWKAMPAERFFKSVLLITIVKTYYSHPLAWNETGYSGPSSPRGHFRKWEGGVDPWEAQEKK